MDETFILDRALEALKQSTNITTDEIVREAAGTAETSYDAVLTLTKGAYGETFNVEVKRRPSLSVLAVLLNNHKAPGYQSRHKLLIVADYINPNVAAFLKDNQCAFIDAVGNAYLDFEPVYVYITGFKAPKAVAADKPSRAFQSTGLKLIFNLLCHPDDLMMLNYRQISAATGVSLGSIGWIFNDLKAGGFLVLDQNDKREWLDKHRLIERWVVAFTERLRPKLILGRYQSRSEGWQSEISLNSFSAEWGGEDAADHLTNYLKPALSTIYTDQSPGKLVLMNDLQEVSVSEKWNVEVLQKFWTFQHPEGEPVVPALLVYADLVASGNARNMEIAAMIKQRFLADE